MTRTEKFLFAGTGFLILCIIAAVIFGYVEKSAYEKKIVDLQNVVAERDKTVQLKEGLYQKLTIQSDDLTKLLDKKDTQLNDLKAQLKKSGDDLLAVNVIVLKLQKELESKANVHQQPPDPQDPEKLNISFDSKDDFAPFQVFGNVVADCSRKIDPQVSLKFLQTRNFKLSVAVAQQKDKSWKSVVTSSEKNFNVDIELSGVNPYILEEKWYEKIGLIATLAVGTGPNGLAGIGATYGFGKFDVGIQVFGIADKAGIAPSFGATLIWHPFKKDR